MDKTETVKVRLTPAEKAGMLELAERRGLSLSAWLRASGLGLQPEKLPATARPTPPKAQPPAPTGQLLYCPIAGCAFAARSPQATCPDHGRKVVIPSSDLNPSRTSHGASDDG
jgi:hypothetical protein